MVVPIQRNSETDEVSQGKCDSKDLDIMSHPADTKAWEALEHFDLELVRDPRSVCLGLSTDVFILTARPVVRVLASQFLSCLTICRPTNV
jgi:hypothetical protein